MIDTVAVWGGKLTALQLDADDLRIVQVPGRDVPASMPKPKSRPRHHATPASRDGKSEAPRQAPGTT